MKEGSNWFYFTSPILSLCCSACGSHALVKVGIKRQKRSCKWKPLNLCLEPDRIPFKLMGVVGVRIGLFILGLCNYNDKSSLPPCLFVTKSDYNRKKLILATHLKCLNPLKIHPQLSESFWKDERPPCVLVRCFVFNACLHLWSRFWTVRKTFYCECRLGNWM